SAKARPLPHARNVTWLGSMSNARLTEDVLPHADIFVLPTSFDQVPLVLGEAAAAGLPAVASRMAGTPDLVEHGQSGFLVAAADDVGFVTAIERLLEDDALRTRMSLAAH